MHAWIIWAVVTLVALLIEVLTLGFAVICFAIGALVACLVAFVGGDIVWQLATFSVTTIVALIVVRPLIIRYLAKSKSKVETNAQALVGRRAVVTQDIRDGEGRVRVDGDDWKAETECDTDVLLVGDKVEIVRVESVILIVKRR
ncbi:MAG: NfeD family protein [Rikenellaceae bacterium]